jgi:hypothetical protein
LPVEPEEEMTLAVEEVPEVIDHLSLERLPGEVDLPSLDCHCLLEQITQ